MFVLDILSCCLFRIAYESPEKIASLFGYGVSAFGVLDIEFATIYVFWS